MYVCRLELVVYTHSHRVELDSNYSNLLALFFSFLELIHGCFHIKPLTLMVCLTLHSIMGVWSGGFAALLGLAAWSLAQRLAYEPV